MKEVIWEILVLLLRIIPRSIRNLLCRLLFAAAARGDTKTACIDLLKLQETLMWQINTAAIRYGNGIHPKHWLMKYHEFFTSHLREGERVLDVGCGYGALADSMAQGGAIVYGIDFNSDSIAQARQRYTNPNLHFIVGDITDTVLPEDVETIVMSNVLEHIEKRQSLLDRLNRELSPRRFLIRVPMINRDWVVPFRIELGLPYFADPTHFIEYTREIFEDEMHQSGLEVVSYEVKWGEIYAEVIPI